MTQGALQLMGSLNPKRPLNGSLHGVQFLPFPYDYRCPFGLKGDAGIQANLNYIETVLTDPEGGVPLAAGMILEIIQGEGGVIPAPDHWIQGIRKLTAQAGVPLIIDEVQTGLGRTGKMFAFEHASITPDVIVLSKALGGSLPMSVVIYKDELDQWQPGAHAGTFRGNQMAMAAGSATLQHIRTEGLPHHAEQMGKRFMSQLNELRRDYPTIGDVRGRGLMIGVEITDPENKNNTLGHPPAAPTIAAKIQAECLRYGLIVELGGRHGSVVRFLPPLVITQQQIDKVFDIFSTAVHAVHHFPKINKPWAKNAA